MSIHPFEADVYFQLASELIENLKKSKEFSLAVKMLFRCWQGNGTVFTMGCGGSAANASHFAADLAKTTIIKGKKRFKAISLTDNAPLISAWTNDSGWEKVFTEQLQPWITKNDVLVGFSVHGGLSKTSKNLNLAFELAKKKGAKILGFSGFDGGKMAKLADVNLLVPISKEPYATGLIESLHTLLAHGIIFQLKEIISRS